MGPYLIEERLLCISKYLNGYFKPATSLVDIVIEKGLL
jgi:hypothetical protein